MRIFPGDAVNSILGSPILNISQGSMPLDHPTSLCLLHSTFAPVERMMRVRRLNLWIWCSQTLMKPCDPVYLVGRVEVFIQRKVNPARRVTLTMKKLGWLGYTDFLFFNFSIHVNGLTHFLRKSMKSWLTLGSLGRGKTHIQGMTLFD